MEGYILQRKDTSKQRFVIRIRGLQITRNDNGHLISSQEEAERLLTAIRCAIDNDCFNKQKYSKHSRKRRFPEAFTAWMNDKSAGYRRRIKQLYEHQYLPFFKQMFVEDINNGHIEDFEKLHKDSPSYSLYMRVLQSFINKYYFRNRSPKDKPEFGAIPDARRREGWLTQEQQEYVFTNMHPVCKPIFRFMCRYGCRPGEAIGLDWGDVKDSTIYLRITKTAKSGVRINQLPAIDGILPQRSAISGPVFRNSNGTKFGLRTLQLSLTRAMKRAGLPHLTITEFARHSFASQRISAGKSPAIIGECMSHSKGSYTTQRYSHISQEAKKNVISISTKMVHAQNDVTNNDK
jgi:integrase